MARGHRRRAGTLGAASHADRPGCPPAGPSSARGRLGGHRGTGRRDGGSQPCARASCTRPKSFGSVMGHEDYGICVRSASRPMPPVSWTFTTRRSSCGRVRPPGSMAARPRHADGVAGLDTDCGMAHPTGSWQPWPRPEKWSAGPIRRGILCARWLRIWSDTARTVMMRRTRHWDCPWGAGWSKAPANGSSNNDARGLGCVGVRTVFIISCT